MKNFHLYRVIALCLLIFANVACVAQTRGDIKDPTKEQLQEFKDLADKRTEDLLLYIQQLSDKEIPLNLRKRSLNAALSLFEKTDTTTREGKKTLYPTIQISSTTGPTRAIPVNEYLENLMDLKHFAKVKVTSYQVNYSTPFKKGPDGRYHSTSYYYQNFVGEYNDKKMVYRSKDRKAINVMVGQSYKDDTFIMSFGNITVEETESSISN